MALLRLAGASLVIAQIAVAQDVVWGSVIFTRYGERTPLSLPVNAELTPLGAQQLYSGGNFFRDRYVSPPYSGDPPISGISTDYIDSNQISIISTTDQFIEGSAQAFLQGLYPPVNVSSIDNVSPTSLLADGTKVGGPLGGYQYPQIYTASILDPNTIFVAGEVDCPNFDDSALKYFDSPEFTAVETSTRDFYARLQPWVMNGELSNSTLTYKNAYDIFDYLNYEYNHNETVKKGLSSDDFARARTLADQWQYAINGNTAASGNIAGDRIQTVAGQTMAAQVVGFLLDNIQSEGASDKLNLIFSSFEPMIAFAALADLPHIDSNFYGLPDYGSSMVFEMFSTDPAILSNSSFPDLEDLYVRFLFRNGTDESEELTSYPLFGLSPSEIDMQLSDFISSMEGIMLSDVGDWCTACNARTVFCASYTNDTATKNSTTSSGGSSSSTTPHSPLLSNNNSSMKPAVAGIIGAIIALVLTALVLGAFMLFGGLRVHRKRRSDLGGFKAGHKLASDQDLSLDKSGVGVSVVADHKEGAGQERVGSWELGQHQMVHKEIVPGAEGDFKRKPSYEDDGLSIHRYTEAVKPDERV